MQAVVDYLKSNQARFVSELSDYLRFPSVSAQPHHKQDLRACAEWVVSHCRNIGLEAELRATEGNPVVIAKTPRASPPKDPSPEAAQRSSPSTLQPFSPLT